MLLVIIAVLCIIRGGQIAARHKVFVAGQDSQKNLLLMKVFLQERLHQYACAPFLCKVNQSIYNFSETMNPPKNH